MLQGNNTFMRQKYLLALAPQSVAASATVDGPAITEPWASGRQLSFILIGGAHGAAAGATCTVQGLRRSDGTTWEALKQNDDVTDLAFTAALLADATQIETTGVVPGSFDMSRIDGKTYSAVRLRYVSDATVGNRLIGALAIISDTYKVPSDTVDDLFHKTVPVT